MRIQVLSDLHLEAGWSPADAARERDLHIDDVGADVIVLAGDTAEGAEGVAWAARQWPEKPVVFVLGNHDPALSSIDETLADCRAAAAGTTVHVLERESITIAGVRILGATLWTDFLLHGDPWATEAAAASGRRRPCGSTKKPCAGSRPSSRREFPRARSLSPTTRRRRDRFTRAGRPT